LTLDGGGKSLRKNQQFFMIKVNSERLKKSNYNIEITIDQARANSEIITINNSQLLRTLFSYKNINFNQTEIDTLLDIRKNLRKLENCEENQRKLLKIEEKIEKILFIDYFVNVEFKHKSHYLTILKRKGFYINGTRYVPFMASAGMIRKNTAMFIDNNLKHPIMDILENGRDESIPMVSAKFGAYFSLYSSSTLPVSFPRFIVVPDKIIKTVERVDLVTYDSIGKDDHVVETDYEIEANAWDGQGLISPELAKQWSDELELDYTFSAAVIRAPFLKGLVVTFDIHKFAEEIAKSYDVVDIYGNEHDIRNIDLVISESMFKLWLAYKNTDYYTEKCHENNLGFAVAKVNAKNDNSHSRTSYQFLQVLNLKETDIAKLCQPTIDWFREISGGTPEKMILYATGETSFEPKDFKKMDIATKAILLNPALSRDRYIQGRFVKTIQKKKKESYMGSVLINANYQFMIGDPYYQACHIFKLNKKPLLKRGEHYSEHWLKKGILKLTAIRSPIVHHSEVNILNLKNTIDVSYWYKHIHSGIIFPANGIGMDCAIHGGADFDGDLICTINNSTMAKGRIKSLPIIYESRKSEKKIINSRDDEEQVECQLNGYNSKVGFATNISSSLYSLLEEFTAGSKEHNQILKRLKIGRVIQGEIIDSVKGLKVPPFRDHWTKRRKPPKDATVEDRKLVEFYNSILCEIRPSFFRFLYPHYMSRYNKELKKYNLYSHLTLQESFDDICKKEKRNLEENSVLESYKNNSYFLDNNSVVNKISRYMRMSLGLIGKFSSKSSKDSDYKILIDENYKINPYELLKMKSYLQEYKAFKKGMRHDLTNSYSNLDAFMTYLRKECLLNISSNESELANYAIEATYGGELSMVNFAWSMWPSGILQNIIKNSSGKISFPVLDENGDVEYLWKKYSFKDYDLEELYNEE